MISVERMWEGIREEGVGSGLPMAFLKLGIGNSYSLPEDLVREVMERTRCKWICIFGEDTTQVGMGSVVKGLTAVGMYSEIEISGTVKDPGWLNSVDRWIVDYVPKFTFNISALRGQDSVRFTVKDSGSLGLVDRGLESQELRLFPGTKYIKLTAKGPELLNLYNQEALRIARKYDRTRVYKG